MESFRTIRFSNGDIFFDSNGRPYVEGLVDSTCNCAHSTISGIPGRSECAVCDCYRNIGYPFESVRECMFCTCWNGPKYKEVFEALVKHYDKTPITSIKQKPRKKEFNRFSEIDLVM